MAEPEEGHGGPRSPLFLNQTEAQRAEKFFWKTAPPYLRVWMTVPPPLSQGVDPRTVDAATQAIVSLCRTISDKIEVEVEVVVVAALSSLVALPREKILDMRRFCVPEKPTI